MWKQFLSKRLGTAIAGIITVVQSGADPLEMTIAITTIVATYIVAETTRPSGGTDDE